MPPKKATTTAAKAPAVAKPKPTAAAAAPAAPVAPPAPTFDHLTLAQLQAKIAEITALKEANATKGKALDDKLTRAFKTAPKRPTISVDKIEEEMVKLEHRRNTTSMSLNDEKYILRELQLLGEKKKQVEEFNQFQIWVDATRAERNERFQQNRNYETQLQQLHSGIRKAALASKLGKRLTEFTTLEMTIPEDKVGSVVGKGFTMARKIEAECGVLLDIENKSNVIQITSIPVNIQQAKLAIENITLATNFSIGLHPDTIKVLMSQKAKNLQELEQKLGLKLDVDKTDGTLSTIAAPTKSKLLQKAIHELEESKIEIQLPAEIVPKLIGKKGETINQLMEDTGCLVDIDKVTNAVKLIGTAESVGMANKFVLELIDDQSQRERTFSAHDREFFPSADFATFKFHFFAEFLMGNKGLQLKLLRTDASDAKIKILKDEQSIHVMGNKLQLRAMEEALRERLREFESHHWLFEVPDSYLLSLIIGKKGAKIKQVEQACHVKIEIQGDHVCVLGETANADIDQAKKTILELVDQNQRSVYVTSQHLISVLFNNKRAKLNEIEKTSGCKLNVPTGASSFLYGGGAGDKSKSSATSTEKVKITLTGTLEAITNAKHQLETLDESHHVRYFPLDDDEVATVIGKKGETISQLEKTSGARLRVLRESGDAETTNNGNGNNTKGSAELEMLGTQEQLTVVQQAIDTLLQTQNRAILQLDPFATGCLIGKKGERIKTMRLSHPDATLDAFPTRGQVRIKAANAEALQACVDHVLQVLRETLVVESVKVSANATAKTANFNAILEKNPAVATRLQELEAEGGENTKVTIQEDGKLAKIRGPAMGIGELKSFLEMLVAMGDEDAHFVETIKLPSLAFGSVLLAKAAAATVATTTHSKERSTATAAMTLNDNVLRICKTTGCEIRLKKIASSTGGAAGSGSGSGGATGPAQGGVVVIEGANPTKVYDAKDQVQKVLYFYHSESIATLENLPLSAVPRLYELLPTLSHKLNVVFALASKTTLKVITDNARATKDVVARLQKELLAWKKQHVEVAIPSWVVPVLVGKNGENIKKLASDSNNAKLDLNPVGVVSSVSSVSSSAGKSSSGFRNNQSNQPHHNDRVLTVSARDDATVQLAVANVKAFIALHLNRTSTLDVQKSKLELVLSVKKDTPAGVQLYVVHNTGKDGVVQIVLYGGEHEARESVIEKMEHLVETSVLETIVLPSSSSAAGGAATAAGASIVGALIGKSGANIKALQKEFPDVKIDIKREDNSICLRGPKDQVAQVKNVMEDKVRELLRQQEAYEERNRQYDEERRQQRRGGPATAGGAPPGASGEGDKTKDAPAAEGGEEEDDVASQENDKQQANSHNHFQSRPPVGGSGVVDESKLTKNQRRRLRKRAENEKKSDDL